MDKSFFRLEDVKKTVDKMEQAVQFRIPAARDNEIIKRLYSLERGRLLFALPPKVKIVSTKRYFSGMLQVEKTNPSHIFLVLTHMFI